MERRDFLKSIAAGAGALSLSQVETLFAARGYHQDGPYNGPLKSTYVNTTCGACPGGCGITVRRVDGIPVKIDGNAVHPVNRGGLCPVGVSSLALLVHPDRIRQPLLRSGPRGSGQFTPISWDDAQGRVLDKLGELRSGSTPEQLLYMDARDSGPGAELARRFVADFGSPNYYSTADPSARIAAAVWGGDANAIDYDLENARLIYCFGHPSFEGGRNPVYFAGLRSRLLSRAEGLRGRFISIDSRLSASAAKSERWVPIRPRSHGLLALGLAYLIIKEQLYDRETVDRFCVGFEDETDSQGNRTEGFKNFVLKHFYPGFVAKRTGVPVDQIIGLARLFASTPGAVAVAGNAVSQTVDGIYQQWAVMSLNALTGRIGATGGIVERRRVPLASLKPNPVNAEPLVAGSTQGFPYLDGAGGVESLPERILSGTPYPVKVAIVNGADPLHGSPRAGRFRQAFQNIPFSVVFATLKNATCDSADLVLPACSYLEKHDLVLPDSDFSHPVVALTQPVIAPLHESRPADDVLVSWGGRLFGGDWESWGDYASYVKARVRELHESNAGSQFSDQFKVSFESLLAQRGWRRAEYRDFDDFWEQFQKAGGWWEPLAAPETGLTRFPTPSGKFYFDSEPLRARFRDDESSLSPLLRNAGLRPVNGSGFRLGSYREFEESEDAQYPFSLYLIELTTLRGIGGRLDKMAEMVGYYANVKWESWVELSPETAEELHLKDHQLVRLESPHGHQTLRLVLNHGLVPGVAAVPVGLGRHGDSGFGENVNELVSTERDCFSGVPAHAETKVRIMPA